MSCVHVGAWIRVWVLSAAGVCIQGCVLGESCGCARGCARGLVGVHVCGHVDLGVGACLYKGEVWTHTCGGVWMPGS